MRKQGLFAAVALLAWPWVATAQEQQPAPPPQPQLEKPGMATEEEKPAEKKPAPKPAEKPKAPVDPESGRVIEEIIARVNNEVITRSDYNREIAQAEEDAQQDCQGRCNPEQLATAIEERKKNALRDLIDQSLLVQRGKDMGISVETDVIKQLDQIRQQNKIADMDALEKAVSGQGLNWEDFKNNIRNKILVQKVISQEVGQHITIGHDDALKYYNEHKSEFARPEQVALAEISISTDGKKETEIPDLKKKAETALQRVKDGEDFGEIAKRFSDGSTKTQGGYLGMYKRGELAKAIEEKVFAMKHNELTDVIETKQGFLILRVLEHYDEGEQPFDKVQNEIMNQLYSQKMDPAMKEYLKTLREQSYVVIKPEFASSGGGGNSEIQEVSASPEASKEKKGKKKYWLFGKRSET